MMALQWALLFCCFCVIKVKRSSFTGSVFTVMQQFPSNFFLPVLAELNVKEMHLLHRTLWCTMLRDSVLQQICCCSWLMTTWSVIGRLARTAHAFGTCVSAHAWAEHVYRYAYICRYVVWTHSLSQACMQALCGTLRGINAISIKSMFHCVRVIGWWLHCPFNTALAPVGKRIDVTFMQPTYG